MDTEVSIPPAHINLENITRKKLLQIHSHLMRLKNLPPMHKDAERRVVHLEIVYNEIVGYQIFDYHNQAVMHRAYFSTGELEKMLEK